MNVEELLAWAHSQEVEYVDLRYMVFPGRWEHHTVTLGELERHFGTGHPVFVPSVSPAYGLVPDPQTAVIDPFCQHATLAVICDVLDSRSGQPHPTDLRGVLRRAAAALRAGEHAEQVAIGAIVECYVFDQVCFEQGSSTAGYRIDCREGVWRRGRDEPDNLGTQLAPGSGRGSLPPFDTLHNLRGEMIAALWAAGGPVVGHYHAAGAGQIGFELSGVSLLNAADQFLQAKYILRNAAARQGKVVTFMPKPLATDAASRLLLRLSMSRGGSELLTDEEAGTLTELGRYAVGGLLAHAASLLAFLCPTTNGYRVRSGEDGMPTLVVRFLDGGPIEISGGHPACQPYLAYSAVALAALDGIQRRLDPGPRVDEPEPHWAPAGPLPDSLEAALHVLREDHKYLLLGEAWSEELVRGWIEHKLEREVRPLRQYPHPYEYCLYFGA